MPGIAVFSFLLGGGKAQIYLTAAQRLDLSVKNTQIIGVIVAEDVAGLVHLSRTAVRAEQRQIYVYYGKAAATYLI